jgi:hypothetical protein
MARLTFSLRVRAEPGIDATRSLSAWLERGLRDYGLRCLEVHQEVTQEETNMPIDLSDTELQDSPIPSDVYRLRAKLMAGTAGTDYLLKRAKNGVSLMLALECTVMDGDHRDRKIWDYITCELDEQDAITPLPQEKLQKLQTSVRLGRIKLRAIIDSACKLNPEDKSETAQAKRRSFDSYAAFDGIVFWAQVGQRPAANGYRASNNVDVIITPDLPDYPKDNDNSGTSVNKPLPPSKSVATGGSLRDALDDDVPF